MDDELKRLAEEVLEKAVDKIEYKIAEDKDGRVWLLIDNSGHDIEIGDMETEDACCYEAYGKLFGFANAAPQLAKAVLEMLKRAEDAEAKAKRLRGLLKECLMDIEFGELGLDDLRKRIRCTVQDQL